MNVSFELFFKIKKMYFINNILAIYPEKKKYGTDLLAKKASGEQKNYTSHQYLRYGVKKL